MSESGAREGGLDAPTRHQIDWNNPDFLDPEKIDEELRRVFDICHGCRRCFNLCDSFPRLFDLIDDSESGELDTVESTDFKPVVDACTLCDMCYMTKCPYVPPHEFDLDFPHLMLRYRAAEFKRGEVGFFDRQLAATDRNGKLAAPVAPLANWASARGNSLTRPLLEAVAGVHRDADLPKYQSRSLVAKARKDAPAINESAPAFGRKAVLYATCFSNYNKPDIGLATRAVLAQNGVETEIVYPTCCGMPQFEHGDLDAVAAKARKAAAELAPWVEKGYAVVAMVASCALMLKFEWPLLLPNDPQIKALADATYDVSEYVVDIAKKEGIADGMKPLSGGVSVHLACHARAQNMGPKAVEMVKLIPDADVAVIERCSGHGGSWGIKKDFFEIGMKVGKPVAKAAVNNAKPYVVSECPLACDHILQGMERVEANSAPDRSYHPVELLALAYEN